MILSELTLTQFRSYIKRAFTFSPGVTLIIAPNASGKTNVLEAIYFLATGKSFRADTDRESIRFGQEIARMKGKVGDTTLELVITQGEVGGKKTPLKKYLVNGISKRQIDFVGNIRAVLFWPEHLELVTDSPSLRRRYLDSVLVQVDREYRRNLISYERGLRQRNKLLDSIALGTASRSQLLFWNQLLIKAGSYLTDKRAAYIEFINAFQLRGHERNRLVYDKSVISESRLEQYRDEEIAAKATLVGPHRDDFAFFLESGHERDLSKYGSRGEQRLSVLWLKLAEVLYVEHETADRPILLLDDIFSELDEEHRGFVLDAIARQQSILTTADVDMIPKAVQRNAAVIRL